jgi:hypothetical protein
MRRSFRAVVPATAALVLRLVATGVASATTDPRQNGEEP